MDLHLSDAEWAAAVLSLKVAGVAVAGGLPLAIGAAWLLARRRFPGKWLFEGILHLPLVLPPVVVGYLLLVAFGRNGVIGGWLYEVFGVSIAFTWKAAALAAAIMGFPLMVRAIRLAFEAVDGGLENAARTLGAGPWRVFLTVTAPLAMPGILAGAILGFARALGEFGATIAFAANIPGETRTLPLAIYSALQSPTGEAAAMRLAIIATILALVAVAASEALGRWARRRASGYDG